MKKENKKNLEQNADKGWIRGRICEVQRGLYTVKCEYGLTHAKVKGSMKEMETPVIGDYVWLEYHEEGNSVIMQLCFRKSIFVRPDSRDYVNQVQKISDRVKVYAVSSKTGYGMEQLKLYLHKDSTIVLLGSSGVGKSTLVNTLLGIEVMKVSEIRENDAKGRHTTTHRQLLDLMDGVTIIDTPGIRELGMCDVESGIHDTFSDIAEITATCRFNNCHHETEPGCQIRAALEKGTLEMERWKLYQSLRKESELGKRKRR